MGGVAVGLGAGACIVLMPALDAAQLSWRALLWLAGAGLLAWPWIAFVLRKGARRAPRGEQGFGRVVVLGFDRGEKLREGIRNAALVSAIGTFEKARFHRIKNTNQKPEDEIFEVEGPLELSSVEGIVADGEPHFHMTFQDLDRAYAAHLEDGSVVCYLAEVVLAELKGVELTRVRNEHGIALIRKKV